MSPSPQQIASISRPSPSVSVAELAREPLLLAEEAKAPEFNQFTVEMCRTAGFTPTVYGGTVESIRAAADLVAQGRPGDVETSRLADHRRPAVTLAG